MSYNKDHARGSFLDDLSDFNATECIKRIVDLVKNEAEICDIIDELKDYGYLPKSFEEY